MFTESNAFLICANEILSLGSSKDRAIFMNT
jgi:hypothetical protein